MHSVPLELQISTCTCRDNAQAPIIPCVKRCNFPFGDNLYTTVFAINYNTWIGFVSMILKLLSSRIEHSIVDLWNSDRITTQNQTCTTSSHETDNGLETLSKKTGRHPKFNSPNSHRRFPNITSIRLHTYMQRLASHFYNNVVTFWHWKIMQTFSKIRFISSLFIFASKIFEITESPSLHSLLGRSTTEEGWNLTQNNYRSLVGPTFAEWYSSYRYSRQEKA